MERSRAQRHLSASLWKSGSNYQPFEYACRDTTTGALRPVPPGTTRAAAFCPHCRAERCLLDRDRPPPPARPGRAENNAAWRAQRRGAGLSSAGRPLARRCWNCVHLRRVAGVDVELYVCGWRHGDSPRAVLLREARSRKTMLCRPPTEPKHGCGGTAFALRLGPVEDWKGNSRE